jgi:hypothetical protein
MCIVFDQQHIADVFCHHSEPHCLALAVRDLQSDLHKVSGQQADIKPYLPRDEDGYIVVGSLDNAAFCAWLAERSIDTTAIAGRWEHFLLCTFGAQQQNLLICGSDARGAMFGVYDVCERCLGVDPLYFWTDNEPARRQQLVLSPLHMIDGPKTFTYRGVFVNDEDLLTDWRDGGGKRYTTYPFYHQVVHHDIITRVVETALRLKMNLIIPASLLDIDNPAEENLVRLVTERGLFISQHHVEPLGVSHFAWDNYWAKLGEQAPASFVTHRAEFEEIWEYYARKWARYAGVIWQLGLRGRGDRPVWWSDANAPATDAERGALISSAYAAQYAILKRVLGHDDFVSTATLWLEGSDLQKAGVLTYPQRTMLIFSDHGPTQMMRDDYYLTRREPQRQYGLYHHVAFWGDGPHLVDGTSLDKLYFNYANAAERGDTTYSILNVCNVREFVIGMEAVARMNWDFAAFSPQAYLDGWIARHCGASAVAAVNQVYQRHMAAYVTLRSNRFDGEMLLIDGITRILGVNLLDALAGSFKLPDFRHGSFREQFATAADLATWLMQQLPAAIARWQDVLDACYDALPQVKPERRTFFVDHFVVQAEIMYGLYAWCHSLAQAVAEHETGNAAAARQRLSDALFHMQKLLLDRRKAEHGAWQDWYRGDKKMNLPGIVDRMKVLLETKGEAQ